MKCTRHKVRQGYSTIPVASGWQENLMCTYRWPKHILFPDSVRPPLRPEDAVLSTISLRKTKNTTTNKLEWAQMHLKTGSGSPMGQLYPDHSVILVGPFQLRVFCDSVNS